MRFLGALLLVLGFTFPATAAKLDCSEVAAERMRLAEAAANLVRNTEAGKDSKIDRPEQYAALNAAAGKLRKITEEKGCGVAIVNGRNSAWLRYLKGDVREDLFNYTEDGKIVSWQRVTEKGEATTANFESDKAQLVSFQ